jgi:hypothetical protein
MIVVPRNWISRVEPIVRLSEAPLSAAAALMLGIR